MANAHRFTVFVDGKWQGGSFATQAEAEAVGKSFCKGTSKKFEVRTKGGLPKGQSEAKK